MKDDIANIWSRIEAVLTIHAPEVKKTLAPGATETMLTEFERSIGFPLPADFRQSLKIHNGQFDPSRCLKFCGVWTLLQLEDSLRESRTLCEMGQDLDRENGANPDGLWLNARWWKRSCIPFADCEGNYLGVDMDPSIGSDIGRVMVHVHDCVMETNHSPNYMSWLAHVAECLEAKRFDRAPHGFFDVKLEIQ